MQHSELHSFFTFLLVSWLLVSCSSNNSEIKGTEYNVEISLESDSTIITDNLVLFIDNHHDINADTIKLNRNNVATYSGITAGTDELYLFSDEGQELCRFYATPGSKIDISISGKADSLVVDYTSPSDTINKWLQSLRCESANGSATASKLLQGTLDSLRNCGENGLRTTLLLREYMTSIKDSIYVRRYIGGITESGKPDWLIKSIEGLFPQLRPDNNLGRLAAAQFQMQDTVAVINTASRSDYLLLYFWGDVSQQSIDSLKSITNRLHKQYSDKRLTYMTFCISAPDSTWWESQIKDLPEGHHALISGGFADQRLSDWSVDHIPYIMLTDMFTNIQNRNRWNEELRKSLERIPQRSNINNNRQITKALNRK